MERGIHRKGLIFTVGWRAQLARVSPAHGKRTATHTQRSRMLRQSKNGVMRKGRWPDKSFYSDARIDDVVAINEGQFPPHDPWSGARVET